MWNTATQPTRTVAPFARWHPIFTRGESLPRLNGVDLENTLHRNDHAGIEAKAELCAFLGDAGWDVHDLGPGAEDGRVDYPDYAERVARRVLDEDCRSVLLCGTESVSQSLLTRSITRAALVHSEEQRLWQENTTTPTFL